VGVSSITIVEQVVFYEQIFKRTDSPGRLLYGETDLSPIIVPLLVPILALNGTYDPLFSCPFALYLALSSLVIKGSKEAR
jgi:hypothetical protein